MSFKLLGDIVKIKGGKRLPKSSQLQVIKNDHPYIRVRDMGERYLPRSGLEYVPDNIFPSISRYIVNTNDLILSIVGTVGLVSIVDEFFNNASLTENCVKLTGLDEKDAKYLYYYLLSQYGKEEIKARTIGAVQLKLPLYNIEKIQIRWFDKLIREKIVNCLSTLDDKIELNNQTNQNLENIAQAIFKSWFIDFDPVRAKIAAKQEGKDPEITAMCAISGKSEVELEQMAKEDFVELQATAALFPDELVESELGEVPKGWEISKISKIGKVITGKTPSSKIENSFAEKGTFFITPTDIDTEVFVTNTNRYLSEYGEIAIKNSKVDAGSLCITCIGSQMGKVVITPKSAFTNQQINSILLFNSTLRNYIFLNLRQRRDEIFLIGSGGSTMPIINKSTFESLNLILPDLALIRKFDNFISPFFNNILSNSVENIELKNIRDALLPELLAGKINVSMLKDM
ncbi:restriction endonuclease subunit S [Acinetobacter sp. YH12025]|uniref:restriction endonuclease subunit S n=1 Tax=Acinetobacter sp. YH12025 TaxID=2601042 RepID=UPI0015D2BDCA